jgi:hypothetical protein
LLAVLQQVVVLLLGLVMRLQVVQVHHQLGQVQQQQEVEVACRQRYKQHWRMH